MGVFFFTLVYFVYYLATSLLVKRMSSNKISGYLIKMISLWYGALYSIRSTFAIAYCIMSIFAVMKDTAQKCLNLIMFFFVRFGSSTVFISNVISLTATLKSFVHKIVLLFFYLFHTLYMHKRSKWYPMQYSVLGVDNTMEEEQKLDGQRTIRYKKSIFTSFCLK